MQSVETLRDKLAEAMGWIKGRGVDPAIEGCPPAWNKPGSRSLFHGTHPVTLSLDWLAAHGLPEGWRWYGVLWGSQVEAGVLSPDLCAHKKYGETELHARLAACVAAWESTNERTKP